MHAGRLNIKIHSAKIAPGVLKDGDKAQCAVKIVDYGALCTSPAASPGCSFEEELSFELGPIDDSAHGTAQVILYRDEDRTEIGRGSLNLLDFAASDGPTNFKVPVTDTTGKPAGAVTATVRLFPSRSPGKVRDGWLGQERIDEQLVTAGQRGAPRELNQRSPRHSKEYSDNGF